MVWLGYALGLVVGTTFGFWLHKFWESDLTGVGSPQPPTFDLFVPVVFFVLAIVALGFAARRREQ